MVALASCVQASDGSVMTYPYGRNDRLLSAS